MRVIHSLALAAGLLTAAAEAGSPPPADREADLAKTADVQRGQMLYESRCIACHSLDSDRVGPHHRGVYGRRAGSVDGYAYSKAVKGSDIVWNVATLDAWLTNPQALIPGQKMNFRVAAPDDRLDIIAYLKQESGG
jgi:cytochrome c